MACCCAVTLQAPYSTGPGGGGGGGGGGGPSGGENPPCNTLFVGNLAEGVNESELQAIFAPHQVRSGAGQEAARLDGGDLLAPR